MLGAREDKEFTTPHNATYYSHDLRPENDFYQEARELLETGNRPLWLTRRFAWMREGVWDMTTTRRALWHFAMAGGVGAVWGYYPPGSEHSGEGEYDPEPLAYYRDFWQEHFLPDMEPSNNPGNGTLVLHSPLSHFIFYREDTANVEFDLTGAAGPLNVTARDTGNGGDVIEIGELEPAEHNWQAPYVSDWVITAGY